MNASRAPILSVTDGVVLLRAPEPGDAQILIAGRDAVFHRWLGPGVDDPHPTFCIVVRGKIVGWVDYDDEPEWLLPGEVNVGYNVFARHRGRGYASRAVQLLMHHLSVCTDERVARLNIDAGNERSLALATRLQFRLDRQDQGQWSFQRPVPPITYTDGVVTLRRPRVEDIDADLLAKDDEQVRWLWLPGQRATWHAMSPDAQRDHAQRGLTDRRESFGSGPKWTFSVDARDADYVAYVDCDLANSQVPAGEANISYSAHPAYRGRGYVSRSVRLVLHFLYEHTAAREAHLVVDAQNEASLRVVRAIGAAPAGQWVDDQGRTMVRHVAPVDTAIPARPLSDRGSGPAADTST